MGIGKSLSPGVRGTVVTFVILAVAAEKRADDRQLFPEGDEGCDILSKLSASLSHHMMHIDGPDAHRFGAAVGWRPGAGVSGDAVGRCGSRHGELCEV